MPVKVRPQSRIAADNSRLPAAIPLIIGCDCHFNTCPSGHVPLTTNIVPTKEVSNLTSWPQLWHLRNNDNNCDSNTMNLRSFTESWILGSSELLISGSYVSSCSCTTLKEFQSYTYSCIKTYVSSSSVKLKVVAVIRVDGCLGDDVARKMSTCTSASLVVGGSGCMLTHTGWLIVKHGARSCLNHKIYASCVMPATNHIVSRCLS